MVCHIFSILLCLILKSFASDLLSKCYSLTVDVDQVLFFYSSEKMEENLSLIQWNLY